MYRPQLSVLVALRIAILGSLTWKVLGGPQSEAKKDNSDSSSRLKLSSRLPGFFSFVTPTNATAHPVVLKPNRTITHTKQTGNGTEKERELCEPHPLTPALWAKLDMNKYLDTYPHGNSLDLEQYAAHVGAVDFQCGVGRVCNPNQLCESVYGKDWYALVAAQNWNNFVNTLYQASGDAFDVVSDVLPTMLIDFEKDNARTPRHYTACISLLSNWISSFPASLFKAYGPIPGSIWMSWGTVSWLIIVMTLFQLTAFGWVETLVLVGDGEDRFTRSSDLTWMLGQAQHAVQGAISNVTHNILSYGISTDKGLASVNRDGIFLSASPVVDRETLQKEYEKVLKLKTLVKIWRIQNVFIVRGADPCTQEGVNGAFSDPNRLSYCGEDSIMMSIVRGEVHGNSFEPHIYRASLVESKYGFTTEYLTTKSWQCQKKYNVFDFDPYEHRNATTYIDPHMQEECIVNIPVCDCTKPDMISALKNGVPLTKACREIDGLPI
ncbi:hypothetical protein O181_021122 [Austropuccinia psidii MF-1]|uniref:DUF7872 domain-containing protein n=1 Tax=Austropuccinia psidii MF-1 TaxID=1389203 RepID=A0A9Q3GVY8_9BASI|nr:hypothetical protein [Austropuccinia psidii MF-1]